MNGHALVHAWFVIVVITGCTSEEPQPVGDLAPIPYPNTVRMERAVRLQLDSARETVNVLLADPSTDARELADAIRLLGRLFLGYNLSQAARACFENIAALDPNDAPAPYYLGYLEHERGDFEAARRHFLESLENDDEYQATWIRLGHAELELGNVTAARNAFRRAQKLRASAAAAFGLGRVAMQVGDYEQAVRHFSNALSHQPQATQVHYHLATAYRKLGDQTAATDQLRQRGNTPVHISDPLIENVTDNLVGAAAHNMRGDRAAVTGQYRVAAEAYQAAVAADTNNFFYRKSLGITLYALGQAAPAIEALTHALQLDPGGTPEQRDRETLIVHYNLAGILANQHSFTDAEGHFRAVLAIDLTHRDAAFHLARILGAQERYDETIEWLTAVLQRAPEDREALELRATTQMDAGRFAEAVPDLQRLVLLDPGNGRAKRLLTVALERAGKRD